MDKRRTPRYAVSLNALVHPSVGRSWLCSIRDFCSGGMLLAEQDSGRKRSLPGIAQNETVGIHFSVPGPKGDQHFRLEGKIVRVMDSGVGITFARGMDEDALKALMSLSNTQPVNSKPPQPGSRSQGAQGGNRTGGLSQLPDGTTGITMADARKVIAVIRKEVARILPEMSSAFFGYMDQELLSLARDAKSNAVQSDYFAAMSNLEKAKKSISQSFASEILDQIDNPRDLAKLLEERKAAESERKQKQASRVKLSLVNTDEFEDWLAVANIISRSERVYERYLTDIQTRLGMLVDSWGHNEANPLGTAVFCHAFDNAIRRVDLSRDIRQRVYSGFESKAVPLFRKLYIAVTRMLEESGIFPDLDDDFITPGAVIKTAEKPPEAVKKKEEPALELPKEENKAVPKEPAKPLAAAPKRTPPPAQDDDDEPDELREEIEQLRARLEERQGARQRAREEKRGRDRENGVAPTAARKTRKTARGDIGEAVSNIYSTVRNLIGRDSRELQLEDDDDDVELVQLHEVQELLSSLRTEFQSSDSRIPVRKRLQEQAISGGRNRRIPAAALESLGVVENLVDSIEDDAMLSGTAKDWIRQLELTLDKVATNNDDFLSVENPHRALDVINQLARLGSADSGGIRRNVDEIVSYINDNFDSDPNVFDEALDKLKPLVDRQSRAFSGNVQRTVKASEGQQTLINAQRAVVEEMNGLFSGREVPEVLLKLLMPGWRNLLVNTHLRQGRESSDWRQQIQAIEQVFQYLDGKESPDAPDYIPPEKLVDQIERGLDSIAFEPGQRTPLLNTLRRYIVEGEDHTKIPRIELPEAMIATTLGFGEVGEKEGRRQELRQKNEEDDEWRRWLDRAEGIHVGEWLEIKEDKAQQDEIAIVAWTDEEHTTFVFVNRRGVKTHELVVEDLATRLKDGRARILDEADIPLTDRASHRMLQNMHNQLTHQATHDELTGLINRKEFERQLQRVLGLAKRNDLNHLVAYIDLDQFKVINNSAGHDTGDRLLKEMAHLLQDHLGNGPTILSRLGGDEFGLLIENCERETGLSVVKQLTDVIKGFRFKTGAVTHTLTASCGVVVVDSEIESVSGILSGADSACFAAKDAGRDRIHVYEANDSDMEHRRDVMEFVSQIDSAIKEDRFILNCQKIAPIDTDSGDHVHYEILLTVLDDKNEPMPPQDFIVAAETYNRMGVIDRWVIKNAFKFIASNILKFDNLGAFSINISGNSLTEDDFMEFVLEQFNETRLPTSKICFEITETSAIGRLDAAIEFMEKLKVTGVQFSLDDFGTGLSSYSYLRNLPVDFLKIDGIFVKDIKTNPNDYAVVKSINEIGHFMGKKTIAEYVEDDEILEILREIGVDFAQGYGIERKRPITELVS